MIPFVLLAIAVLLGAVIFLYRRLNAHAERIDRYYLGAVGAWIIYDDEAARLAALTAAKVAAADQRESMVKALNAIAHAHLR